MGAKADWVRKFLGRGAKGALLAGGLVAVGSYLAFSDRGNKFDPDMQPVPALPPLLTAQDLMMQNQRMAMESGPVEGMAPDHFQRQVLANRGMSPQQQQAQLNASQPAMSAVSPESVQQLGTNARLQGA